MATQKVDTKNWIVIYPAYIDQTLTLEEGRKVSKEISTPNPTIIELKSACDKLNIKYALEKKCYPRQQWVIGRIKIQLKDENGNLTTKYKNRMEVYRAVATLVKSSRPAPKQDPKKKGKK